MSKIPVRKCSECGKYNDLAVSECRCGKKLKTAPIKIMETDELSAQERGTLREGLEVYFQKCPGCGTVNFTLSDEEPVKICYKCAKNRIAMISRVLYVSEEPKAEETKEVIDPIITGENPTAGEEEEDDEDDARSDWKNTIRHIKGESKISISAIGQLSVKQEIGIQDVPFMMGRSASFKDFLDADLRVGNEHCLLIYRDGEWYVKDNNSQNGTFLNNKDLGLGGEEKLHNGNLLKLGHNVDSPTFMISINS